MTQIDAPTPSATLNAPAAGITENLRRKIEAVRLVQDGKTPHQAAELTGYEAGTVRALAKAFSEGGLPHLDRSQALHLADLRSDFDAARLRRLLEHVETPNDRLRLIALAAMYDGDSTKSISEDLGVSTYKLTLWRDEFNAMGPRVSVRTNFKARVQADLRVTLVETDEQIALLGRTLDGERRERVLALSLSKGGLAVDAVALRLDRPRSWVVETFKTYKAGGMSAVAGLPVAPTVAQGRFGKPKLPRDLQKLTSGAVARLAETAPEHLRQDLAMLSLFIKDGSLLAVRKVHGDDAMRVKETLKRIEEGGLDAFLKSAPVAMVASEEIEPLLDLDEMLDAADKTPHAGLARQLRILVRFFRGEDRNSLAAEAGVKVSTVVSWASNFQNIGYDRFVSKWEKPVVPDAPKRRAEPVKAVVEASSAAAAKPREEEAVTLARMRMPTRLGEFAPVRAADLKAIMKIAETGKTASRKELAQRIVGGMRKKSRESDLRVIRQWAAILAPQIVAASGQSHRDYLGAAGVTLEDCVAMARTATSERWRKSTAAVAEVLGSGDMRAAASKVDGRADDVLAAIQQVASAWPLLAAELSAHLRANPRQDGGVAEQRAKAAAPEVGQRQKALLTLLAGNGGAGLDLAKATLAVVDGTSAAEAAKTNDVDAGELAAALSDVPEFLRLRADTIVNQALPNPRMDVAVVEHLLSRVSGTLERKLLACSGFLRGESIDAIERHLRSRGHDIQWDRVIADIVDVNENWNRYEKNAATTSRPVAA